MTRGKCVLVAGGAGFLGSHLCEWLLDDGSRVFCLDNFQTGKLENISRLLGHRNFRVLKHDIIEPFELRVEEIYNLACPASPVHYQADPIQTLKASVHGSISLLDLAARHKARILQASTSEVYGDPRQHPQPKTNLNKGLRDTIAYFRNRLAENRPVLHRHQIPLLEQPIRLKQHTGPVLDDRRTAAPHEASSKLPQSLA